MTFLSFTLYMWCGLCYSAIVTVSCVCCASWLTQLLMKLHYVMLAA